MLIVTSEAGAGALDNLLGQFDQAGQRLDVPALPGSAPLDQVGQLAVVRIRTPWAIARKTTDAGSSATALGERLQPGTDAADSPLKNPDYQLTITGATSTTITVSDDAEDLVYAGARVALAGTNRDDWYTVDAVSTSGGSTTITLKGQLPTNASGKTLIIPRAMGRVGTANLVTVVTRSRHDVTVAINAGGEYVLLSRPRCWVILDENLGPATIVTGGGNRAIRPTKAKATVLIESDVAGEPDDLITTDEQLTIVNYDESLNLLAETVMETELSGLNWIPISPSCNVSLLRDT